MSTEQVNLSDYQIIIGGEDTVAAQLKNTPEEKRRPKLEVLLKEMRVRLGTLLKTDNVSFLFGAGASMTPGAGGFPLSSIPLPLEVLLNKRSDEEAQPGEAEWLSLFYETTTALKKDATYSRDSRYGDLFQTMEEDAQPIEVNLEEYLSQLQLWLAGLGETWNSTTLAVRTDDGLVLQRSALERLLAEIQRGLCILLDLPSQKDVDALKFHKLFIKKVLTRPINLRRANLFTLNYDTMIEQAADAEGAVLVDGFVGTVRRVFRPESYDIDFYFPAQTTEGRVHRFDRALHLHKLHGSLTWHREEPPSWQNPHGLYATYFDEKSEGDNVVIYPSPLKYGQALDLPFSELFRRFGNAIAQPQSVLFTIGYGFGDEHVNALIRQALAIPSFTLIVVDPTPTSPLVRKLEELKDQRVWIVRGPALGRFECFVEALLPDLQEEDIQKRVVETFNALHPGNASGSDDPERAKGGDPAAHPEESLASGEPGNNARLSPQVEAEETRDGK